jgi:hypothetical protein
VGSFVDVSVTPGFSWLEEQHIVNEKPLLKLVVFKGLHLCAFTPIFHSSPRFNLLDLLCAFGLSWPD